MNRLIGVAALSGLLVLGACGGGGNGPVSETQPDLDYSNSARERHSYTAKPAHTPTPWGAATTQHWSTSAGTWNRRRTCATS